MADNLRLLLVVLLSSLGLIGAFVVVGGLFPGVVARTRRAVDDTPSSAFWLGLVNIIFLTAVGVGLTGLGEGAGLGLLQLPALAFFGILLSMLLFGLTAVAEMLGERLFPDTPPVGQNWRGAGLLLIASLTPVIGWFGIFVYACCTGVGGFILGWSRQPRQGAGENSTIEM